MLDADGVSSAAASPSRSLRLGGGRDRARAAVALAAGRLRLRHRALFHRRPRAGLVGGFCAWSLAAYCGGVSWRAGGRSRFRSRLGSPPSPRASPSPRCKTARIAHPVLPRRGIERDLAGFVEIREERERTDRIVRARRSDRGGAHRRRSPSACALSVRKGTAPPVGSFVELKARLSPPLAAAAARRLRLRARPVFPAASARPASCSARSRPMAPPARARLVAALRQRHRGHPRGDRRAHPRRAARRQGRDRLGADHRQARRDLHAGQRRHVHFQPRPRAVDLRLSHGGGRGRRVLRRARACSR